MANECSSKANKPRSGLNSGLDVFEILTTRRVASLTEIARELSMSKSGVHSLLAILVERGYAERTSEGTYRLGFRAWGLGGSSGPAEVARIAAPFMSQLAQEIEEGAILGTLVGFDVVYLHVVESRQAVRVNAEIGARIPANCTSTGVALLSALTDDRIRALLPEKLSGLTPHTLVDPEKLLVEVEATRKRGYAVNRGGWRVDVGGIAVAVRDRQNHAVAGLCVSAPLYRMDKGWLARVVPATIAAGQRISSSLAPLGGSISGLESA
jgi:IclR family KDG regulon transcriptional repressor